MPSLRNNLAIVSFSLALLIASASLALGQSSTTKEVSSAANTNPQLVDARQNGEWNVGINPAKNSVRLTNSDVDPLAVKVIGGQSARKPFQFRLLINPIGNGNQSQSYAIPAGKRLVIENVSAIARCPVGYRMEINFFTYLDNGDGVGDSSDITFHRIALTDQGAFDTTFIASANHKVLVFADERIGTTQFGLVLQARLNAVIPTNAFAQAQVTFSGYLEDLPLTQ
jgi:hypothetical protein